MTELCVLTKMINYINDPANVIDEAKYIRRSSVGSSLGKLETQLNMNYLHGVGFITGTVGEFHIVIVKPNPYGTINNIWIIHPKRWDIIQSKMAQDNCSMLDVLIKHEYIESVYSPEEAMSLLKVKLLKEKQDVQVD